MRFILTLALALGLSLPVVAGENPTLATIFRSGTGAGSTKLLDAAAINASQTMTVYLGKKYSKLEVTVDYTNSAATAVTGEVYCNPDDSITTARRQTRACASGTCTTSDQLDSKTVSANAIWTWEYDVSTCHTFVLILDGTSADASDVVDVYAIGTVR